VGRDCGDFVSFMCQYFIRAIQTGGLFFDLLRSRSTSPVAGDFPKYFDGLKNGDVRGKTMYRNYSSAVLKRCAKIFFMGLAWLHRH
jgi:hypothetical protein